MRTQPARCTVMGHPTPCNTSPGNVVYFKPVPGGEVFGVCVFLIVACLVWMGLWLHRGVKFEEE